MVCTEKVWSPLGGCAQKEHMPVEYRVLPHGGEKITPELLRRVADTTNLIKSGPVQLSAGDIYELLLECL